MCVCVCLCLCDWRQLITEVFYLFRGSFLFSHILSQCFIKIIFELSGVHNIHEYEFFFQKVISLVPKKKASGENFCRCSTLSFLIILEKLSQIYVRLRPIQRLNVSDKTVCKRKACHPRKSKKIWYGYLRVFPLPLQFWKKLVYGI